MNLFRLFVICASLVSTPSFAGKFLGSTFNLPGAPVTGSAEDLSDYQTLLGYQNTRLPDDCKRASSEVSISLATFFGAPYGTLTAQEVSDWTPFINSLNSNAYATISTAKNEWQRERPYLAHSDIHPCITLESSTSYPSGHSALAELYARVLEIAFPTRTADFKARALQIALDRSLGGVHYPTDIRDGNLLGDQIYDSQNVNGELDREIQNYHP